MDNEKEIINKIKEIEENIDSTESGILRELAVLKNEIKTLKDNNLIQINESTVYRNSDKQFFTISPKFDSLEMYEPEHVFTYSESATYSDIYNEHKPYVSVIIPVYNAEKYLAETLNSILAQKLHNIEIICVNDGSTDNTLNILEDYSKKDKRVKIIQKENGGQASARNKGLEIAKGDFIGFMDSDDLIPKDYYEKLYKNAIIYNADIVQCRYWMVQENGDKEEWALNPIIMKNESRNSHFKNKLILAYASGVVWNKIYKKEILNTVRFAENTSPWEDNPFVVEAFLKANKIVSIPDIYHNYIQRNNSSIHEPNPRVHFQLLKSTEYLIDYLNNKKNKIRKKDYKEFNSHIVNRLNYEYCQAFSNNKMSKKDKKRYSKMHHRLLFKIKYLPLSDKLNCTTEISAFKRHLKNLLAPFVILELIVRLIKNIFLLPYYFIKEEVFNK